MIKLFLGTDNGELTETLLRRYGYADWNCHVQA